MSNAILYIRRKRYLNLMEKEVIKALNKAEIPFELQINIYLTKEPIVRTPGENLWIGMDEIRKFCPSTPSKGNFF